MSLSFVAPGQVQKRSLRGRGCQLPSSFSPINGSVGEAETEQQFLVPWSDIQFNKKSAPVEEKDKHWNLLSAHVPREGVQWMGGPEERVSCESRD